MADSDKKPNPGKRSNSGEGGTRQGDGEQSDGRDKFPRHNLIGALNHKVRRQVLRRLHASERPLSPCKLARELDVPVTNLSYHMVVLNDCGAVSVVDEQRVRGAIEHFYESQVVDHPGVRAMLDETEAGDEGQIKR